MRLPKFVRRIILAIRIFFLTLFRSAVAAQVQQLLEARAAEKAAGEAPEPTPKAPPKPKAPPRPKAPVRSEAVTLLATLQREARFVDFIKEPLGEYSDAQIGAVARDVHRDCAQVIERLFGLVPIVDGEEGSPVEVPAGFDAGRFRLTGNVTGQPPFTGQLAHHGWQATRTKLPDYSGSPATALVVAPAEVELA
jgi:hypothetical protein